MPVGNTRTAMYSVLLLLLRLAVLSTVSNALGETPPPVTTQSGKGLKNVTSLILEQIRENMDYRVRPSAHEDPVDVRCGFFIMSFGSVSALDMDYTMDIYLRQRWTDPRVEYSPNLGPAHVVLSARAIENMWVPDIFFPNEKASYFHEVTVPNKLMRVFPNGTIVYSVRITLTLSCPMDLSHFPMDHQRCAIGLESYAYETSDMTLTWFDDDPVDVDSSVELPQFDLLSWDTVNCAREYKTGNFPCLKAQFSMQRQYGFFLLQTYIPSMLIVVLSWVSFWINMDAVPARISLGVTTVLTMATQLSGAKSSIPKVSYPKAIDVWMATCMLFVFLALLEYAFVNAMSRKKTPKREERMDEEEEDGEKPRRKKSPVTQGHCAGKKYTSLKRYFASREWARMMDKGSRVLFPSSFIVFNIIYWAFYTNPNQ